MDVTAGKHNRKSHSVSVGLVLLQIRSLFPSAQGFSLISLCPSQGRTLGAGILGGFGSSTRAVGAGGGLITCLSAGEGAAAEGEGSSCGYEISHSVEKWV